MLGLLCTFRFDWDRWVVMGVIGVVTGLVGVLLHQLVHLIGRLKWTQANAFIQVSQRYINICRQIRTLHYSIMTSLYCLVTGALVR